MEGPRVSSQRSTQGDAGFGAAHAGAFAITHSTDRIVNDGRSESASNAQWKTMRVVQGEYVVSKFPDACLTTLLGSCIATCLWDPEIKIGGMNHYLLPGSETNDAGQVRYGVNAMELLVNGMLKRGAHKARLVAKVFGGASMLNVKSDIGERNVAFAKQF